MFVAVRFEIPICMQILYGLAVVLAVVVMSCAVVGDDGVVLASR